MERGSAQSWYGFGFMTNPYVGVRSSLTTGHFFSASCCRTVVMKTNTSFRATFSLRHFWIPIPKMKIFSIRFLFSSLFSFRNLSGLSKLGLSQIVLYKIDKNKNFLRICFITFAFVANFSIIILLWIKSFIQVQNNVYKVTYAYLCVCVCVHAWVCCFPAGAAVKNLPASADVDSTLGSGRSPWKRKWQPTPIFLPGKFHGQRTWQATVQGLKRVRHD